MTHESGRPILDITLAAQSRLSLREIQLQSLLTDDGQTGSYRFVGLVSINALGLPNLASFQVVAHPEGAVQVHLLT